MALRCVRTAPPAKINLFLRIGTPRADGFHPLATWMCTIDLCDTLLVTAAPAESGQVAAQSICTLSCDDPSLPTGQDNLVVRAAARLAEAVRTAGHEAGAPGAVFPVSARLEKKIPHGAGLGGGSSDAAGMLQALNLQWDLGWTRAQLEPIAASIGSDVPFFLHAPSAICCGRGEVIRPIRPPSAAGWAMLVLPRIRLSTASVYRRFDEMALGSTHLSARPAVEVAEEAATEWSSRISLPSEALLPMLANDLEPAAFSLRPDLQSLREAVERTLDGRPVRMSGSGSALFTLYDELLPARAAAERVRRAHDVPALAVSLAPAPGPAEVVEPEGGAAENGSS